MLIDGEMVFKMGSHLPILEAPAPPLTYGNPKATNRVHGKPRKSCRTHMVPKHARISPIRLFLGNMFASESIKEPVKRAKKRTFAPGSVLQMRGGFAGLENSGVLVWD